MNDKLYTLSMSRGHQAAKLWMTFTAAIRRLIVLWRNRDADVVYLQRELLPVGPPIFERWIQKRGMLLIFDYDDALFIKKDSRYNQLASFFRSPQKIADIIRMADLTIAGNDWLREQATSLGGRAVTVEVAEDTTSYLTKNYEDNVVTIGWLGSPSTSKYLNLIADQLREVAKQHPDVKWVMVGGGEFSMQGVPWQMRDWSFENEKQALHQFDIGLMPLPDEEWSLGKSGGKARTYMAASVVPVVSAVGYNRQLVEDQRTGILIEDTADWAGALSGLITSPDRRKEMSQAAVQDVKTRFPVDGQAKKILKAITNAFNHAQPDWPIAIVMGLSPTGLHIARSVKRLGASVIGVGRPGEVGLSSSVLSQSITDDGSFDVFERLEQILNGRPAVLLPSSDEYVELIGTAERPAFQCQGSYHSGAAELLLTKSDFYAKCDELGLKYPRTTTLAKDAPKEALSAVNLPVLLKPSRMHDHKALMRGKKGWVINDQEELDHLWPELEAFPGELVAQEFIPGPESEIRLVCGSIRAKGEVSSLFTSRKLRQYPRGIGSASVVQSSEEPEAADMALTFLKSIGYQGIFGAEMKKHRDTGDLYFIEINPRTSLWFSVSEAAGCPVVQQAYLDVFQPTAEPLKCRQLPGVRWRYWSKDTVTQLGYMFQPRAVFPKPEMDDAGPVQKKTWAVYETGDPWPAFVEPLGLARKLLRRIFGASTSK